MTLDWLKLALNPSLSLTSRNQQRISPTSGELGLPLAVKLGYL